MQQQATETLNYQQHHFIKEPITATTAPATATSCSTSANYHAHGTIDTTNTQTSLHNGQQTLFDYYEREPTASNQCNNDNNINLGIIDDSCSPSQYYTNGSTSNNNNHLENIYYETPTPDNNQSSYTSYGPSNNYLITQRNSTHPDARDPSNTISFDLDEINEVIQGEEFIYQSAIVKQEIDAQNGVVQPETKAAIYENLKNILIDATQSDGSSSATTPSPAQATYYTPRLANMAADHQLNNSTTTADKANDLFKRLVTNNSPVSKPYVEIIEQPSKCSLRFRYKCEGRSAGSLPGVNSTPDNKTYPTIRINNYKGRAVVVISCVTKDAPYRAHPHNIVGKEGCKKGICTIVLSGNQDSNEAAAAAAADESNDSEQQNQNRDHQTPSPTKDKAQTSAPDTLDASNCMIRTFSSLGIQCVKRKDIEDSLGLRESINVDPFRNGFSHKLDTSAIDLNVVRLCFQVFIEGSSPYKCDTPLTPVVSDPIHDKKAMSDLVITKLSHCSAPATGGREVILLCDRISKDDIQIRFFEESRDGELIWETFSDISAADVHKQVAICFRTPKYYNEEITQPVMARIQLRRISDQQVSEPRLFQFLPCESDEDIISRKRKKVEWCNMNQYALDNILQAAPSQHQHPIQHPQQPPHHHQQQYQQIMQPPPSQQQQHHHPQQQHSQQQQQQQHMSLMNRQQQQQ